MWEISSDPLDLFNIILIVDAARNYLVIPSFQLQLMEYSRVSGEVVPIQSIHDGFRVFHWTKGDCPLDQIYPDTPLNVARQSGRDLCTFLRSS